MASCCSRRYSVKFDLPRFLDKTTKREVDLLYLTLVHSARFTCLPEIYECFGREATIRFLDIFGGMTVQVPSHEALAKSIRDVEIYLAYKKLGGIAEASRECGENLEITQAAVERIGKLVKDV